MVGFSGIDKTDTVIEIGTGKGHLTEELCRKAGYVFSVELDSGLLETAAKRLGQRTNLSLIPGDFLQYKLPARGRYQVFANIPYAITTQIVEKLTEAPNPPEDIWLVMEAGAARRFTGLGKETERSLLLKVYWNLEIRYRFRREDFHPSPSVESVLVHFSGKKEPDLCRKDYINFRRFVKHSMKYGISGPQALLTRRQVSVALKQAGLPHAHEDGVTLYIQWLCLFRYYESLHMDRK